MFYYIIPTLTMILGCNLLIVSIVSYIFSSNFSPTLFLPFIFGVIIIGLSIVGGSQSASRIKSMHGVIVVSFIAFLGTAMRLPKSYQKLQSLPEVSGLAFYSQLTTATICALILFATLFSFLKSRVNNKTPYL